MKITLTAGEVSKIVLNHLRNTGRIPTEVEPEKVSRGYENLNNGYSSADNTELLEYSFEVPE